MRSEKNKLYGSSCGTYSPTLHRLFGARSRGFTGLLLLLLTSSSFCAHAQTAQQVAVSAPVDIAAQAVLPLAMRNLHATADSHGLAASGGKKRRLIVLGFVGGFARSTDQGHPEVQFAEYLQDQYHSAVYAEVFENHHGREALNTILRLLDSDGNGALSNSEKKEAGIILYGHSWGAAETVLIARELGKRGIPVLLTIQVDSIAKFGRNEFMIPSNVENAINLYQSRGPLHGLEKIIATDPAQTRIIGNLHMTYKGRSINCDNYPWFSRVFNKPHHEVENDPRVWTLAASLIDSEFANR
jgi:hypothetical protein